VFAWNGEKRDNTDIYVTMIGIRLDAPAYEGPPSAITFPAWSPDGGLIAFRRVTGSGRSEILLISPLGGPERKIAEIAFETVGVSFGGEGFPPHQTVSGSPPLIKSRRTGPSAIFLVSLETGEKRRLTSPGDGF